MVILMEVKQSYQIYEILENIDKETYRKVICKNIKNFRLELYNQYKKEYNNAESSNNPYSTENVSSYLELSKVHYKRLENENDSNKYVSLDNLIKLSYIFDKKLDDFLK